MEKILTLFEVENSRYEFEIGEKLWNMSAKNTNVSLASFIKLLNVSDVVGRRAYWSYVILEKCHLRERLEQNGKIELLHGVKNYVFVNYSKLIKTCAKDINNITEELEECIYDIFTRTVKLPEKEIRNLINEKIKYLHADEISIKELNKSMEENQSTDIIDNEKELLKTDICMLKKQIDDLKTENEKLRNNQKDIETIISEYSSKVKTDIFRVTSRFMIAISMMMLAVSVLK